MIAKDSLSVALILTSFLVLMMELSAPTMAFPSTDLIGSHQDSLYDPAENTGDNIPEMLQLLEALLETNYDDRTAKSLTDDKPFPAIAKAVTPHTKNELTSLLDRILTVSASLTQEPKIFPPSLDAAGYLDDVPVVTSKRARDEVYGAMPPLNELCRMMRVKCY